MTAPVLFAAPGLLVVLRLEAAPQLLWDCLNEAEELRLRDWLAAQHRELLAAVEAALAKERAA